MARKTHLTGHFLVKCVFEILVKWHIWVYDIPLSFCSTRRLHYISQLRVVIMRHVNCSWRKVQIYTLRIWWVPVFLGKQELHELRIRSMWSHFKKKVFSLMCLNIVNTKLCKCCYGNEVKIMENNVIVLLIHVISYVPFFYICSSFPYTRSNT